MLFCLIFCIYKDVIKVHYHKDVKLLRQNLVNVSLKCNWYVNQSKKYHLVLEMAIVGPEGHFLFLSFSDPHPMVGIGQVKLGETSSLT